MSNRQVQKMFQLMAGGEPVELTSAMASVKKLARLAFIAQQFGYEYADVRQGGQNGSLKMLIVPDPSPQARARAAQNWAQFPQAAGGGALPPLVPDALELLKARINFDLTGRSAEKRMGFGAVGLTVGMAIGVMRASGDGVTYVIASWAVLMVILGVGFLVTRKRNAKFAARLQASGFMPVTDETGRVRYLPPGGQLPGHANPFGPFGAAGPAHGNPFGTADPGHGNPYGTADPGHANPYGTADPGHANPYGAADPGHGNPLGAAGAGHGNPFGSPTPGPHPPGSHAPGPHAPGPYAAAPPAPGPYAAPPTPGTYAAPQASAPYAAPQPPAPYPPPQAPGPYGGPPAPYAHPGPGPAAPIPPQPQPPHPQEPPQSHPRHPPHQ
ncbi:hypothetical protein [Streptomyces albicerus]|uniref:hypothetical protein n=1 Tax=Streptomyces albicerus TaxID=2569859 RepID=UPI00124B022F|nr:hypothetical protein [Streptomyces albicerus]